MTWGRRHACSALACAAAWLATGGSPVASSAQGSSTTRELRVLTFNIHHAEGTDGTLDVARVARVITESRADVVGLQEVDRGVERTGRRDLLKEIADLTGMRYAFGKNIDHQGGDYGNALLTTLPILSEGNKHLPTDSGGEQRGVLQVVLDVGGTRVLVLTTHLDYRREGTQRVASAEALLGMLEAWEQGPAIVMGDFNDTPGSATHTRLLSAFSDVWSAVGRGDGFTIPVESPNRRIDWILVRGLEPVRAEVLHTNASDHLPVVATLRLR